MTNSGISIVLIGVVIGGVVGSLLVLLVLLLLALVWMTKKYKRGANLLQQQEQPKASEQREAIHQHEHQQHQGDEVMEMKNNNAYVSTTQQISTQDNVAYSQIGSDHNLLSDQCEYDYI